MTAVDLCRAATASGERCRRRPGLSGFCSQHDPQKVKEREAEEKRKRAEEVARAAKSEPLKQVVSTVETTCRAKGWIFRLDHQDEQTWRHASVWVARPTPGGFGSSYTEAAIEITVDDGVKCTIQRTTGPNLGVTELSDAIKSDLGRLPWLLPAEKAQMARKNYALLEERRT